MKSRQVLAVFASVAFVAACGASATMPSTGDRPDGSDASSLSSADASEAAATEDGSAALDGATLFDDGSAAGLDAKAMPDADAATARPSAPLSTPVQPLLSGTGFYPRAIKLADGIIVVSVVAPQASGNLGATLLESQDDGVSFQIIGHVDDARATGGLCCGTLYQLPRSVGGLSAGTLLWSASVGGNDTNKAMSLPIWSSSDDGRSWTYLSTVVTTAAPRKGGIWEPEFSLLDDGTLLCHYSDETDPAHSQKLTSQSSSDGIHWGSQADTVALSDTGGRPGMANVRRTASGTFFMSYEVCGALGCTAHLRTSPDGENWGDPKDAGLLPATADGLVFEHAPTLAWVDAPTPSGTLYLIGQLVFNAARQKDPASGRILFGNAQSGGSSWYEIPAPIPIPDAFDNFCPNYSSSILPLDDGVAALEVASRVVPIATGTDCRPFFARGPLAAAATGDK